MYSRMTRKKDIQCDIISTRTSLGKMEYMKWMGGDPEAEADKQSESQFTNKSESQFTNKGDRKL